MPNGGLGEDPKNGKGFNALAALRDIVLIVAILTYFAGFTYYSDVLDQFGLASNIAQFSFYDTLAYSFALFTHFHWLDLLIGAAIVGALSLLALRPERLSSGGQIARNLTMVALVFSVLWLIHYLAYVKARTFMLSERRNPDNYVHLVLKPHNAWKYAEHEGFEFLNNQKQLTMLFQTADTYYILAQFGEGPAPSPPPHPPDETVYELPYGYVFAVPRVDVATVVTVLPEVIRNEKK